MGFWNVGGLKSKDSNKFNNPIFLKEIENFDLILLAETHLGPDCPVLVPIISTESVEKNPNITPGTLVDWGY
jgi:hypothetical protein